MVTRGASRNSRQLAPASLRAKRATKMRIMNNVVFAHCRRCPCRKIRRRRSPFASTSVVSFRLLLLVMITQYHYHCNITLPLTRHTVTNYEKSNQRRGLRREFIARLRHQRTPRINTSFIRSIINSGGDDNDDNDDNDHYDVVSTVGTTTHGTTNEYGYDNTTTTDASISNTTYNNTSNNSNNNTSNKHVNVKY